MSPVKLKDMPIPHKIGPEPVPMTGYERACSQGFRDGYAAADFSPVCIFLCGVSILALIATCMLLMNRASRRNRMRENCLETEIPGKQTRNLASLVLPVFLCFCLLACAGKKSASEIQVSETEVAAEELAPVAPDVANAPEAKNKEAKADAFSPHDAAIGEDKQTLAVHIPEDAGGAPRRDEPTELAELLEMKGQPAKEKTAVKMLRPNAIREAAQLMGFQSGMAWRYGQLLAETENYSPVMDAAFNFAPLLLTQGEALILPPQISSGGASMRIEDADTATSSKTTYELLEPAKFISTVPMWREFLMVDDFPKDVVLIGESRDPDTLRGMMESAEIGVAAYSTLHTRSVPETISRIINVFPFAERLQITATLLSSLRLVVSQRLVPMMDGTGRIALREFLAFTPEIRETLLDTPLERLIQNTELLLMEHGQLMQDAAEKAYRAGKISGGVCKAILAERREREKA